MGLLFRIQYYMSGKGSITSIVIFIFAAVFFLVSIYGFSLTNGNFVFAILGFGSFLAAFLSGVDIILNWSSGGRINFGGD